MNLQRFLLSGAAALAFGMPLAAANASAQEAQPAPAAPAASDAQDSATPLEEIVVTARRREENLQSVPLSVTAFSPDQLERAGIDDRTALADHTPSLISITGGYPSEFAFFALRGQGPAFGSVPGTITYFADVPNTINTDGRPGSYYDLANVQVLAGPQGTLFGKNATGGNVLFVPQRPTDTFGGYVRAEAGNFGDERVEGALNVPVNDRVQLRVAAEQGRRDGYTIDVGPNFNGKDYDNQNYDSGRISLLVQPTDALEIYTIGRYYHSETNGGGTVPVAFNPAAGALGILITDVFPGVPAVVANQANLGPRRVAYDLDEFANTDYYQLINQATYSFSDTLHLKNIFSYSKFSNIYGYDYDATIFPIAGQGQRGDVPTNEVNTYTEELQLQGTLFDNAVNFATGVYADRQNYNQGGHFTQFPFSLLLGGPLPAELDTDGKSQAVFGQATVDMGAFTPLHGLSVTAGYRYTWEQTHSSAVIIAPPGNTGKGDFDYGSYTFTLDYAFNRDIHTYVTARDAFKAGGINASVPEGVQFHEFPPEQLSDIEVGLKSQFFLGDTAIRANIAAYSGNYNDIQRTTAEVIGGAVLNVTRSAAEGRIRGVEFTGAIVPLTGLTLSGSYSYIDSEYTRVTDASAGAILAGSPFPFTPARKYAVSVTYEHDMPGFADLVFDATYAAQSQFSTAQTNQSFIRHIPGYGVLNLSMDANNVAGSPVDLTFFINNVTDNTYATGTADFYNSPFGVATLTFGEPRMYGMRLRYRFGS
ncbi:MAG: TonB-dependent receptor plug domain-containing protein [Terricaulis sp.]